MEVADYGVQMLTLLQSLEELALAGLLYLDRVLMLVLNLKISMLNRLDLLFESLVLVLRLLVILLQLSHLRLQTL